MKSPINSSTFNSHQTSDVSNSKHYYSFGILLIATGAILGYKKRRIMCFIFDLIHRCFYSFGEPPKNWQDAETVTIYDRQGPQSDGITDRQTRIVDTESEKIFKFPYLGKIEGIKISIRAHETVNVHINEGGVGHNYFIVQVSKPKRGPIQLIFEVTTEPFEGELQRYTLMQDGDPRGRLAVDEKFVIAPRDHKIRVHKNLPNEIRGLVVGARSGDELVHASVLDGGVGDPFVTIRVDAGLTVAEAFVKVFV